MRVDLLLALDRTQCSQFVADDIQLKVAAFAFDLYLGTWNLLFQEIFHF